MTTLASSTTYKIQLKQFGRLSNSLRCLDEYCLGSLWTSGPAYGFIGTCMDNSEDSWRHVSIVYCTALKARCVNMDCRRGAK